MRRTSLLRLALLLAVTFGVVACAAVATGDDTATPFAVPAGSGDYTGLFVLIVVGIPVATGLIVAEIGLHNGLSYWNGFFGGLALAYIVLAIACS